MNINVGNRDRAIRGLIGLVLIIASLITPIETFASPAVFWGIIAVGAMALLSSVSGMCLFYKLMGRDTTSPS